MYHEYGEVMNYLNFTFLKGPRLIQQKRVELPFEEHGDFFVRVQR